MNHTLLCVLRTCIYVHVNYGLREYLFMCYYAISSLTIIDYNILVSCVFGGFAIRI